MPTLYLTLLSDFIFSIAAFYYPSRFLLLKKSKWSVFVCFSIFFTTTIFVRLFPQFNESILKTILILAIYSLYVILSFSEKLKNKIIAIILFFTFTFISELLVTTINLMIGIDFRLTYGIMTGKTIGILFESVLIFVFSFITEYIYLRISKRRSTQSGCFILILLSHFSLTLTLSYTINNSKISPSNTSFVIILFISFSIIIISDILLYRVLSENFLNYELKEELATTKYQKQLEFEYYKSLKNNMEQTRKINHDFMNMLSVLQNLIEVDSKTSKSIAQNTINELKDKLNQNKIKQYCNNELVNLIINNKKTSIDNYGIDFSANIQIPETISVKNIDICRIFTNLLDNAIEASIDCTDKTKTFIIISAGIKNDCLLIKCENYYDKALNISKKGKLNSTKDKNSHGGLGVDIIKETVKEYDGKIELTLNDNLFTASIVLKTDDIK